MAQPSIFTCKAAILSLSLFCPIFSGNLLAQFQGNVYLEDSTVKLYDPSSQELPLAWCGGFNNPQFSMGDLDHDGLNDLVVYEKYPGKIKTFNNKGTPGNPAYIYAPHYATNFPKVSEYLILADYNCDNIVDLFQIGNGIDAPNSGFSVYKGYYNTQNELCFTYFKNLFYQGIVPNNAECIPGNIPAIIDVDNDGDLDFVSHSGSGRLIFYKNLRVEDNLPCDSIKIKLENYCWGKTARGSFPNSIHSYILNTCGGDYSGNTVCLFDADGDGDYDYLNGNVNVTSLVFLENGRAQNGGIDSMGSQDTTWLGTTNHTALPSWPSAYNIDYDGDGKKDILVSPHAENMSENYKCIWYYKNTSTTIAPAYTFQSDTLLIHQSIDVGTAAYPMFYDYDKDGKPDLFIGDEGYYQTGGTFRSKLAYYHNTSTQGHPSFQLVSKDLLNIFAQNYYGAAPAFGDLDNDGKDDLVLGHSDGTISLYKNSASSNIVQPMWQLSQPILKDENNTPINVINNAMPFVYDMDKDGKPDLIAGCFLGNIYYYHNVSTGTGLLKLHLDTSKLGGVQVLFFAGKSTPFIGRIDNSGKDYLISGSDNGAIFRYDGFQNGNTSVPFINIDTKYSNLNAGSHCAPTVADIDGDGTYEMVIGNELGGVTIYRQVLDVSIPYQNTNTNPLQLYPNPADGNLFIGMSGEKIANDAEAKIYNSMGQLITTAGKGNNNGTIKINISNIAPGMYFCFLKNEGKMYGGSFIKK